MHTTFRRGPRAVLFCLVLAGGVGGGSAFASDAPVPAKAPRSEGPLLIEKGRTEWGLLAGFGTAHDIWGGRADRQFIQLGGRWGRILTAPVGPGWLKGHFELSFELLPAFVMFQEETTYGASFTLLVRHVLAPGHRLRPFVSLGAGTLVSSKQIPSGTSRLNFTPQAGFGIAIPHGRRAAFFIEYRLHHISNASTAQSNPGINSSTFQFGASLFR